MKTAYESINPNDGHHCTMPDHGKPTATAACAVPKR